MDILGIGPLEFLFILVIALIVLGPKDMVKAGRTIGRALRTIVSSETWRVVQSASREIRNLPNRMMREAGIEDLEKQLGSKESLEKQLGLDELNKSIQQDLNADLSPWSTPPPTIGKPEHVQAAESGAESAPEQPETAADATPESPDADQETSGDESEANPTTAAQDFEAANDSSTAMAEKPADDSSSISASS